MFNITWQLFPINGPYYVPRATTLIMADVAVFVVIIWGAGMMVRTQSKEKTDSQKTISPSNETLK